MNWSDTKNILRHNYVRVGISLCFFVWIIFSLPLHTSKISLHIDEIAWFIDTDAFEQLFLKKDLSSSFWQADQRYDQPPLVKYIYGSYLWAKDAEVFENRVKLEKEWGRWGIYSNPNTTEAGFEIFEPYIRQMRQINSVGLFGTLLAFYILMILIGNTGVVAAMIGTTLLSQNALFLQEMTHATHDGFMLCFMLFSVLFYSLYIKTKQKYWIPLAIVYAVFSVASKLTGIMATIAILTHQIVNMLNQRNQNKPVVVRVLAITSSIFILWVLVNPSLYKDSINNTIKYFSFRLIQTSRLQEAYPSASLVTLPSKVRASWCTLVAPECHGFFEKGTFTSQLWVNVSLLLLGLFYLAQNIYYNTKNEYIGILGIFLFLIIVWNVVLLPMHYGRYYLPTLIGIFFISACGAQMLLLSIFWVLKNKTPAFRRGIFDKTS